jgi:iron complex outermembrane receptor protein
MFDRKPLAVAVQRALSSVAIAATASVPAIAQAQDRLEEVVVTGSRIGTADPNLVTSSPVTMIEAEEFRFRGVTRAEDLLNRLPQVTPHLTSSDSNGSTGTATIDLRGLGPDRTLVLTNGHRMGFGDVFVLAPDINQVPSALIDRVEVMTGGASATYGSDAVAGVVNFIMKRDFEGVQIDYQYSAYQHDQQNKTVQDAIAARAVANPTQFQQAPDSVWHGDTHDVNIVFGVNSPDGRGNITAYLGYRDISPIFQADYDYSACALNATLASGGLTCGGSATSGSGLFAPFDGANYWTVDGNEFVFGIPLYNYGPLNHFQRPDERYTAGMFAHYEVNKHLDAYTEFQFMDDRSLAQIAPSGGFFVNDGLSCDNPLMSAQQAATINAAGYPCVPGNGDFVPWYVGRRNVEGGPRFDDLRHTSYRFLAGIRGEITPEWSYDVFANFSRLVYSETYNNDMSITRIMRALDVRDDGAGNAVCQSVLDGTDPNCVPWNVFQTGGVTQEAIDYLTLPLFSKADMIQDQYVGFVRGDLTNWGLVSPMATEGVQLVLGFEHRNEKMDYTVDQGFSSGDGAGQGGPTVGVAGGVDVTEFFLETKIPLVQGREWIESLTAEFGYRYSDYSGGISTDTWKAQGEWTPVQSVKFRGGYSRAVRAANIRELFEPQSVGLWAGVDPCAGPTPQLSAAACANTGVSAAQYGTVPLSPAAQYNALFGGNPDLQPETSDTFTVGAVFVPEMVPGLNFSIDYWSVEVQDAIDIIGPQTVVTECALTGSASLCSLITRHPTNGNLWVNPDHRVQATNVNIGFFEASGIDFQAGYTREVGNWGSLDFRMIATLLTTWDQQEIPGAAVEDCKGSWGVPCGRPRPEWKHTFNVLWTTPWDVSVSGTWRYVGAVDDVNRVRAYDVDAHNYGDIALVYMPKWINFGETTLSFGVNNITDEDPPANGFFGTIATFGNGNTIPGTWDALGRYFFFGVSQKF